MQKLIESDIKMVRIIEDEFLKHCSTIVKQNINNQSIVNSVKKSQDKFFYVKKIILKAHKENITYRKCLDIDYKKRKKSKTLAKSKKSTFYAYINELRKIWYFAQCHKKWHPAIGVFDKIINNPPIPKKPRIKYDSSQRKEITDLYFSQNKIALNKTNVWLKLKKNNDDYKNLSLRTVCNYIANDERNINYDKRAKIKHDLRKWNIDIGNIQLDVKVIGPKETKFRKYIFIMDAKDEQSKIYWCKVLRHQTKQELINGLYEMINFYKKLGIQIKRVRTDNAMIFKKTNWVKSGEFNRILERHNIEHEYIPLGQPECNGIIERQHRILDEEVIKYIHNCNSIDEFILLMEEYQNFFNYYRYHKYSFMDTNDEECFEIPINFLKKYLPEKIRENIWNKN